MGARAFNRRHTRYITTAVTSFESGASLPFVNIRKDSPDTVVGSTRFMNLGYWADATGHPNTLNAPDAVEIGSTWLSYDAQRTSANTEAKLLMLTHAFDVWNVQRLVLRTDARNEKSRASIERMGATLEGVMRCHMHSSDSANSRLRDTALYPIFRYGYVR